MGYEALKSLGVEEKGVLKLRADDKSPPLSIKDGEQWSSKRLYEQLCLLQKIVPKAVSTDYVQYANVHS